MSSDNENGNEGGGIAQLRKEFEARGKQLEEAQAMLAKYQAQERSSTVGQILKAKGLTEGHAKFYTADDVSEDAVSKWAEENAEFFGATPAGNEPDPNAEAARRAAALMGGNSSSIQNSDAQPLGDPDAIMKAIQTLPYDELVKQGYMPATGVLFNQRH